MSVPKLPVWAMLLIASAAVASPRTGWAQSERYAVIVGNNRGDADEANLLYAESDAVRVRQVMSELGDFRAENVVLLTGASAADMRRSIIALNQRIRVEGKNALLLVYYSGHADARALHLGGSHFDVSELEQLVRGSAAAVRLLVLDSCRSGTLTRVKGATRAPAFDIALDASQVSEGAVFLTASAANEDAQESDRLRGSFFTHYLISGLLGAADDNGDGIVVLAEAYRHAYDATLRASSRTLAGTQHPTFRYDLSGKGDIVLTRPGARKAERALLTFPHGRSYLVMRSSEEGQVVAEVGAQDESRHLSVPAGRYFVRGRGRDHLLEGSVDAKAGQTLPVADGSLARIEYARLVRKGGEGAPSSLQTVEAGMSARSALGNATSSCWGGFVGYGVAFRELDLGGRVGWCRAGAKAQRLDGDVDEFAMEARGSRSFDLPWVTLSPTVAIGGGLFRQTYEPERGAVAPDRHTAHAYLGVGLSAGAQLPVGLVLSSEVAAQTFLYRQREEDGALAPVFGLRISVALGWPLR